MNQFRTYEVKKYENLKEYRKKIIDNNVKTDIKIEDLEFNDTQDDLVNPVEPLKRFSKLNRPGSRE